MGDVRVTNVGMLERMAGWQRKRVDDLRDQLDTAEGALEAINGAIEEQHCRFPMTKDQAFMAGMALRLARSMFGLDEVKHG